MADYTVTRVRKEISKDGSHRQIEGVIAGANIDYTRKEVVDGINAGSTWWSQSGAGRRAKIYPIPACPRCDATPYITTNPDDCTQNNLHNLPEG